MRSTDWIQFTWDLTALPATAPVLDKRYLLAKASKEDADLLEAALTRSYLTEQSWMAEMTERTALMKTLVEDNIPDGSVSFIILKHGSRIIGASGIAEEHSTGRNLVTGICVLNEYRCRGLGGFLLYESLKQLKDRGLVSAKAVTKKGVTAEKFLYSKYGGVSTALAPATA